ncbi:MULTISPECIES: hypothetical protein [Streptomyces]|uniref:hypothetical protein n=1 Tax=Streptomyces TaxID=1883 RepID=UPI0021C11F2A|nr:MULTISPECIES: hypothetical protein [Streptomyces]MCT9142142.1 hypothetical protein [Streptomyces violarus]WNF63771.1 hypothetical protein RJD14_14815 [Streptomyces sp. CGMCC 4.1456]
MRRTALTTLTLAAALLGTQPATAAAEEGWEPAPSTPWDVAAGVRCDFPVHGEPVVDEVVRRVLSTYPDGSERRVAYKGDLVIRVTNTETGAAHDADASGSAVVEYRRDGSQLWAVHGPVFVGVGAGQGTLPRGLYIVDGVYTMDISATGYKAVHLVRGTTDDLCARID